MDGQRHGYVPGSLLGRLRHGAAAGGGRWRKLPPEAAGADTITERNADTDSNPGAHADPVSDPDTDSNPGAHADPVSDPDAGADPDTIGDAVDNSVGNAQRNAITKCDGNADSVGHADTEGNAFGDCAGRFPDPHAGSGGRVAPIPAAAQAARWDTGSHWHCR